MTIPSNPRVQWCTVLGLAVLVTLGAHPARAQEFRGAISGVVADATGAVMPGVTVTVANTGTNLAQEIVTDAEGRYQARYLNPGVYSVVARLDGFKTAVRSEIEVRVGDSLTVDISLELGGVEERIDVVAAPPVLNTTTGVTGQVIDSAQIQELPLADGTAYMLSRLAPGIAETSDLKFSRPMDNGNLGSVVANGVVGGNDFTLDGSPNIVSDRRVGFSPPSDAVSEFKVETNAFDAQQGNTAGATINVALKSGTNRFRGSASWFNRDDSRSENSIFSERAGRALDNRDYNRYAGTVGGPIIRNKTFFMASYEGLKDLAAEPRVLTVPSEKMRRGDFSDLLPLGIQIHDPLSGTSNRTPFPGNVIPADRIDPIAAKLLSYYPLPNQAGRADGTNNYYSPQERTYDYNAILSRVDHNFSPDHRVFGDFYWNKRREDRYNWAGEVSGFEVTRGYDYRSNLGGTAGYTAVLSTTSIADLRVNMSKFGEWRDPAQAFDPASLGFGASTTSLFRGYQYLPRFDITGLDTIGSQRSDYSEGLDRPFYTMSITPTLTRIQGGHTIRTGYEFRDFTWKQVNNGYLAGRYNFTGTYTRVNNSAAVQTGQALAQMLLGIPTSGGNSLIDNNTDGEFTQVSHGFFLQDDWRVSRRLTVNAGVRFDIQPGMTEKDNRNLAGFDTTVANPIEAAAQAKYAASPIPEIPVGQFRTLGGLAFADGAAYDTAYKLLPRGAFSYLLTSRMVVRGGVGLFSYPYFFDAINQTGYSLSTLLVSTENNGSTFIANLQNPFPNGVAATPGSSQGLLTSVGRDLVSSSASLIQPDRENPYYTRWQIGVQVDLGNGWSADAVYIGSKGFNLPARQDLNALPEQYVSKARERDRVQESYLSAAVANPFAGLLPGTSINGNTVSKSQLLIAYPEFLRVATEEYTGSSRYHGAQFKLEKRFSKGVSFLASYTYSDTREKTTYLNGFDAELEDRVSPDDRPHLLKLASVYELPFGRKRRWGSDWNAWVNGVLGGWQVTGTYQFQSGQPLTWGHLYYDPSTDWNDLEVEVGKKVDGRIVGLDVPAWNINGFYFPDAVGSIADTRIALGTANARYFPTTIDNARYRNLHLLDLGFYKNFALPNGRRLQFRLEAINALNYAVYWNPDTNPRSQSFGLFRELRNNPRDVQIGVRFTF